MDIKVVEPYGFCYGVRRAIKLARHALNKGDRVHSIGPIIHNPQVVDKLSAEGLKVIKDLAAVKGGKVMICSHGACPSILETVRKKRFGMVDATCPNVLRSQKICSELKKDGYQIVIVGDKEHPEVRSLIGFSDDKAAVIGSEREAKRLKTNGKLGVVAQTTQSTGNFDKIASAFAEANRGELRIFNTICNDTIKRQKATKELAKRVDAMVVVGGKNSANTRRLFEICKKCGTKAYHVETKDQIKANWFKGKKRVGIASGASTPDWIIEDVVRTLK